MPNLLGNHTAHELSVDMTNWDGFVQQFSSHIQTEGYKWMAAAPSDWNSWKQDWDSFYQKWSAATDHAKKVVIDAQSSFLGWDNAGAEDEYQSVLNVYQGGAVAGSPGGYDALYRRWIDANVSGMQPPPTTVTVNPNTAPDMQLSAFKAADTAVKGVEAANKVLNPLAMPLWEKIALAAGAAVFLGIVIKVAK